jgi:CelD/BcsL family acetyltransferase involved in cellulose biosynthesis
VGAYPAVRISPIRPHELGSAELARWRELQEGDPSLKNPFLAPEFTLAVDRARKHCLVAVLEDGPGIVGFFPYERRALGVGRAIGAGVSDCQGLVHAPGLQWDPRALLRGCELTVWEFDHLLASQAPFAPYHVVPERSPVINISDGYQDYLTTRRPSSRRLIKSTESRARKLEREIGPVRFEFDVQDRRALRSLMRWKSAQYRRTGQFDRFARDWIVRLVEDLYETRGREFAGVLSVLYAADRPVAGHFGIRSASVLSWWFPAFDPAFATYSPGVISLLRAVEAAADAGLGQIDLGRGHEGYKESFKSGDIAIAEGWVERPSGVAVARRAQRTLPRLLREVIVQHPALRQRAHNARERFGRLREKARVGDG